MKKILFFILLIVSIQSFGQTPPGYQSRLVMEKVVSFMIDSTLHIPSYCGTPSGVRSGGSIRDGALAMDTCNSILYIYSTSTWIEVGPSNTDSLFGVQDNLMAANRVVNMNGKVFRWDDVGGGFSTNYHEQQIKDNGYIEYNIEKASTGVSVFESATPGSWAASATNAYGTQYFSVRANPSFEQGQFGNDWNQSGQWVDFLQEQYNDGTNGGSYWFQHREKWTGSTPFTSSLIMMDSLGLSMRTKKTIGSGHTGYKGILVDSNSNVRFENYPSTRNDGLTQKVLYIGNSSGDVNYGYLDTTFYASNARLKKVIDSLPTGGGGTPGGSNKQVQYNNSSAFGGYTGFEVGNTNNDVLITAGATTSVPLNIKLQSSQTANALNISSSSGTGDLASITKDGYLTAARLTASSISATNVVYAGTAGLLQGTSDFAYVPSATNMLTVTGSNSARSSIIVQNLNSAGNASSYWQNDRGSLSTYAGFLVGGSADAGGNLFGLTRADRSFLIADGATSTGLAIGTLTSDDLVLGTNNTTRVTVASGGGLTVSDLAGTLNRPVYVSSTGLLSAAAHTMSKGGFLESPTSADTLDVWQTPVAITITSLKAILRGSSPSVTYNIGFGTNIQSPTAVFTSDITCTSITTECSNSSGFNDATIPAGSFIWIYTNAASGTIRSISFTINYTED